MIFICWADQYSQNYWLVGQLILQLSTKRELEAKRLLLLIKIGFDDYFFSRHLHVNHHVITVFFAILETAQRPMSQVISVITFLFDFDSILSFSPLLDV